MSEIFTVTVIVGILVQGVRLATPYLYASLGETFGQRSGVLNLGVEGQMLMGAFFAFYVVCHCQPKSATGDQRHRLLPIRPGYEHLTLSNAGGRSGNGKKFPTVRDPCAE